MEDDESQFRGIYNKESETLSTFRDGIPIFESIEESLAWAIAQSKICRGSNPDFPFLKHIISTLIGADQVDRYLKPVILDNRPSSESISAARDTIWANIADVEEIQPLICEIEERLTLPIYRKLNVYSSLNSLEYLFDHMRCGIAIVIKKNQIQLFAPFVNDQYTNNWSDHLKTDPPDIATYYRQKGAYYRREQIIDPKNWWANGNIICNEHCPPGQKHTQWWGDNLIVSFKHMLECLCDERKLPDTQFFFNKRDHPQLRADLCEPYDFLFDKRDVPLAENYQSKSFAPILSFYCSKRFADLPIPTTEDWEIAVGKVFPPSFIPGKSGNLEPPRDLYLESNIRKFHVDWENKRNVCFFRGNATGGGVLPKNNQRLRIAEINNNWAQDPLKKGLLDAGVTGFNARDKKIFGEPMRFPRIRDLGLKKASYVEMYKQGTYKYILYIEGHCAANRYSFLMQLGSVIFKVESTCEASELWFFPALEPLDFTDSCSNASSADHVPIKADFSDLQEKIEWCIANDEACRQVAENARKKRERLLSREAILDYMQFLFLKISESGEYPPSWWDPPEIRAAVPKFEKPGKPCFVDRSTNKAQKCRRCKQDSN